MIFSSIPFLYYFLPCVLALYYIVPKYLKNGVLFLGGLVFYAWGEPKALLLMIITILTGYLCGLLIQHFQGTIWSKISLSAGVGISLSFLGYFKYAGFFLENFQRITGLSVPTLKIVLPVGISFYTFQVISYLIDVDRKPVLVQKNLISLGTYVCMFPQLIAGPIVRYEDIAVQLSDRVHSYEQVAYGIRRFVLGMAKKVLIANALGELCGHFYDSHDLSVLYVWLYAVSYMLQIYFDFSGYSDMAIGLGKMFGFTFMENFDYPYVSASITEFWRRWHISLGTWFRDYVYIPLGGNRVSKRRWLLHIVLVWFLTGFWHGAAWNFILWGLYFGVLLIVEKSWLKEYLAKHRFFSHVYVLLAVLLGFVMFNASDVVSGLTWIGSMFGLGGLPLVSAESLYYLRSYFIVLTLAIFGATPLMKRWVPALEEKAACMRIFDILEPVVMILLLVLLTSYFVDGSFNPFLYFRF